MEKTVETCLHNQFCERSCGGVWLLLACREMMFDSLGKV
jgi:hypothetical protein